MSKELLREFFELCEGGVCKDLLTEEDKRFIKHGLTKNKAIGWH